MPHATVIANPSPRAAPLLDRLFPVLGGIFAAHGYTTSLKLTTPAPHSAQNLAAEALDTSQLVCALGGDGTVHAVAQALAGTEVPLGILPFGTHNALARSLGLPRQPHDALAQLMSFEPRRIPLGEVLCAGRSSAFLFMAGAGPAGALAERLARPSVLKRSLGSLAYPLAAAHLFLGRRWPRFRVEYRAAGSSDWQSDEATSLLISRVPSLGGIFGHLTPDAALTQGHLQVHILRAPAHLALPAWLAGLPNPWLRTFNAEELQLHPLESGRETLVQADAEPLGPLPCTFRMHGATLNLLLPRA